MEGGSKNIVDFSPFFILKTAVKIIGREAINYKEMKINYLLIFKEKCFIM